VQVKSAIHRLAYLEAEYPDDVLMLVNGLARVSRAELLHSVDTCKDEIQRTGTFDYDHLRPISQVQIQDFAKLSSRVKRALSQALDVGLLQRPFENRQPQQHAQGLRSRNSAQEAIHKGSTHACGRNGSNLNVGG
jgi:hypothetical protein